MTHPTTGLAPFATRYPLEAFAAIADARWWRADDLRMAKVEDVAALKEAAAADQADRARVEEHEKILDAAIDAHLAAMAAAGALQPIAGTGGREITMADAWNSMAAGTPHPHSHRWLVRSIGSVFTWAFVNMDDTRRGRARDQAPFGYRPPSAEQVGAAWERVCSTMDEGTSDRWRVLRIECQDQTTGDRCEIEFEGWRPTLMRRNERHEFEPARDVPEAPLVEADFDVPTGDLLVTDFLRADGFREATEFEASRDHRELSLSSATGRDARILAHAAEHQIGFTQTTNTSVAVHRNAAGALMVTRRWMCDDDGDELPEDDNGVTIVDGWTSIGSFSCEMWRVMAMDAATAASLMAAGGNADAAAAIERELARPAYDRNVVRVAVEPGRWRIHSGDDFSKRMDRARFGVPEGVMVWCILERAGDLGAAAMDEAA